jgi:hypothetical protein
VEAGAQTFVNGGPTRCIKWNLKDIQADPALPTIAYTAGTTGSIGSNVVTTLSPLHQLTKCIKYKFRVIWTATAGSGYSSFTISLPSGFTLVGGSVGSIRETNGIPLLSALDTNLLQIFISNVSTDACDIHGYLELAQTGY